MFSRRDFLAGSTLLGFGASVPYFLGRTALAADNPSNNSDKILVVVQLTGGNDGLNTVIPFRNDQYYKLRPTLGVAANRVRKVTDDLAFHPNMGGMATLLDEGNLAVIQGVGYPNPSQSHFRSMDIWQAASTVEELKDGWLGRAMKQSPLAGFHIRDKNETSPLALAGAPARVPSLSSLEDFQLRTVAADGNDKQKQDQLIRSASKLEGANADGDKQLLDFVRRTAMNTYASTDRIRNVGKNYQAKGSYPDSGFGQRLKLVAQLIDAGVGARIFYLSKDGFDTHASQGGEAGIHANLLGDVSQSLAAFQADLSAHGHADRVCTVTFSEFGRRARENGSKGTDHGSGAPMFLVGSQVKAGIIGEHPSLTDLEDGNLQFHTDFRQVYAGLLADWLDVDPARVLPGNYKPLPLFG